MSSESTGKTLYQTGKFLLSYELKYWPYFALRPDKKL